MAARPRWGLLGGLLLAGLLFLWIFRHLILTLGVAALLAALLHPLVGRLEARSVPRQAAILVGFVGVALVGFVLFVTLLPNLMAELDRFLGQISPLGEAATREIGLLFGRLSRFGAPWEAVATSIGEGLRGWVSRVATRLDEWLVTLLTQAFQLALSPVIAYYLLRDGPRFRRALLEPLPAGPRREVGALLDRIGHLVAAFVRGQLLVAVLIGTLTAVLLRALGVPFALFGGLVAGLFEVIPYFGPILGGIPAVLLALEQGPATAGWVLVGMLGIHQLEGALISPFVLGRTMALHPLTVMLLVLAGGQVAGVPGLFLAVPVGAVAREIGRSLAGLRLAVDSP
ncbi:AI-2E family transporter [Limnochorda pilosa]|uniref:Permease n=1 Tax=Limnochorda pilosa TaxID=1555112 RepID=A0A0K2SNN9_LIMPI|nr:AI-2E family transporter [Limnochorda pilosa]BAS28449.1 hypothetical protein LIP_2619 [Limnochorda pilosa]